MKTLPPLKIIEEVATEKVKNTPFRVWHYIAALAVLFIVPLLLPTSFLADGVIVWIYLGISAAAWLVSRSIGTNLSRNKSIDSILIYRFFSATPWVISTIVLGIVLLTKQLDDLTKLTSIGLFWISLVAAIMHVLGIIVHLYKNKKMVKNIKKDDLFQ